MATTTTTVAPNQVGGVSQSGSGVRDEFALLEGTRLESWDIVVIVLYFLIVLGFGLWVSEDFPWTADWTKLRKSSVAPNLRIFRFPRIYWRYNAKKTLMTEFRDLGMLWLSCTHRAWFVFLACVTALDPRKYTHFLFTWEQFFSFRSGVPISTSRLLPWKTEKFCARNTKLRRGGGWIIFEGLGPHWSLGFEPISTKWWDKESEGSRKNTHWFAGIWPAGATSRFASSWTPCTAVKIYPWPKSGYLERGRTRVCSASPIVIGWSPCNINVNVDIQLRRTRAVAQFCCGKFWQKNMFIHGFASATEDDFWKKIIWSQTCTVGMPGTSPCYGWPVSLYYRACFKSHPFCEI